MAYSTLEWHLFLTVHAPAHAAATELVIAHSIGYDSKVVQGELADS